MNILVKSTAHTVQLFFKHPFIRSDQTKESIVWIPLASFTLSLYKFIIQSLLSCGNNKYLFIIWTSTWPVVACTTIIHCDILSILQSRRDSSVGKYSTSHAGVWIPMGAWLGSHQCMNEI